MTGATARVVDPVFAREWAHIGRRAGNGAQKPIRTAGFVLVERIEDEPPRAADGRIANAGQ